MHLRLVLAVLSVMSFFACGSAALPCKPSTCAGCCSASGECVLAPSAVSCGGSGSACVMCNAGESCVAGLCAPGGGSGGGGGGIANNDVTGQVNGAPMTIASAAAQRLVIPNNFYVPGSTLSVQGLVIRLNEHTAVCSVTGGLGPASAAKRFLTLRIEGPAAAMPMPLAAGTYTGRLAVQVPDCTTSSNGSNPSTLIDYSSTISITLTEVTNLVRGTFSGSLSSGAPISGRFEASYCGFYDFENSNGVQCR